MTDKAIAAIGRNLAQALDRFARERRDTDKQEVARLHTELCAAVRDEKPEEPEHL